MGGFSTNELQIVMPADYTEKYKICTWWKKVALTKYWTTLLTPGIANKTFNIVGDASTRGGILHIP